MLQRGSGGGPLPFGMTAPEPLVLLAFLQVALYAAELVLRGAPATDAAVTAGTAGGRLRELSASLDAAGGEFLRHAFFASHCGGVRRQRPSPSEQGLPVIATANALREYAGDMEAIRVELEPCRNLKENFQCLAPTAELRGEGRSRP